MPCTASTEATCRSSSMSHVADYSGGTGEAIAGLDPYCCTITRCEGEKAAFYDGQQNCRPGKCLQHLCHNTQSGFLIQKMSVLAHHCKPDRTDSTHSLQYLLNSTLLLLGAKHDEDCKTASPLVPQNADSRLDQSSKQQPHHNQRRLAKNKPDDDTLNNSKAATQSKICYLSIPSETQFKSIH